MDPQFSLSEIFGMADRIERLAARFFTALAERGSTVTRPVILDIARMEEEHALTFAGLRVLLEKPGGLHRDREKYAVILSLMVIQIDAELQVNFTGQEPVEELIAKAIDMEKSTMVFYHGLREMVADEQARQTVEALLREELGHILTLGSFFTRIPRVGRPRLTIGNPLHGQADVH